MLASAEQCCYAEQLWQTCILSSVLQYTYLEAMQFTAWIIHLTGQLHQWVAGSSTNEFHAVSSCAASMDCFFFHSEIHGRKCDVAPRSRTFSTFTFSKSCEPIFSASNWLKRSFWLLEKHVEMRERLGSCSLVLAFSWPVDLSKLKKSQPKYTPWKRGQFVEGSLKSRIVEILPLALLQAFLSKSWRKIIVSSSKDTCY